MKFLRQLFGRNDHAHTLSAPVNGELCQVLAAQSIGHDVQLHVAAGQNALLFNHDKRSAVFPSGEHLLEAHEIRHILDGGQANILFLQISPPVKREWRLALRAEDSAEPLALFGHYTAAIDDTRLFVSAILQSGKMPDSRVVDNWVQQHLRKIFAEQRIPVQDIREHTGKLGAFLHDALIPYLLDCGIRLQNFSFHLHDTAPPATQDAPPPAEALNEAAAPAPSEPVIPALAASDRSAVALEEPAATAHITPPSEPAAPKRHDAPKIFYRLEKGEQVGPYSVDEINAFIEEGKVRRHDLLWHQGMRNWQRAGDFPTLNW